MREAIRRGSLLIDLAGARVEQLNGLSVVQLAGMAFGWPSRITASVRLGAGKVIDIEREVELGGPIHSNGVIIPRANLANLMPREDVVAAGAAGKFQIHAITHADEALALLTGKPAGEIQPDGRYPPGTANAAILAGLDALTAAAERYAMRGERRDAEGTAAR